MTETVDRENAAFAADAEYYAAALSALAEEGVLRLGEDVVVAPEETEAAEKMALFVSDSLLPPGEGTLFADSLASAAMWCAWAGCCFEYGTVMGSGDGIEEVKDVLFEEGPSPERNACARTGLDREPDAAERYGERFAGCFERLFSFMLRRAGFDPEPEDALRLCGAMFIAGTVAERKRLGAGEWSGSQDPAILSRERR